MTEALIQAKMTQIKSIYTVEDRKLNALGIETPAFSEQDLRQMAIDSLEEEAAINASLDVFSSIDLSSLTDEELQEFSQLVDTALDACESEKVIAIFNALDLFLINETEIRNQS